MNLNYHELTMQEARDSPARRKQFLVICTVMAAAFLYSTISAGLLTPVEITTGIFPGGAFAYKSTKRDYAAAPSLQEQILKDLNLKKRQQADVIYSIYLDHPGQVSSGRSQRFASGFLAKTKEDKALKQSLLNMNPNIQPPTRADILELPAYQLWTRLRYKEASLPKVKAAVINFPFTDGFVSSMMHTLRIFPKLRQYAVDQLGEDASVTIITTCSTVDQMCTHYAPLEQGGAFLLGQPRMEEYLTTLPPQSYSLDFEELTRIAKRTKIYKWLFGDGKTNKSSDEL